MSQSLRAFVSQLSSGFQRRNSFVNISRAIGTSPPGVERKEHDEATVTTDGVPVGTLTGGGKHISFTAKQQRISLIADAEVIDVRDESPTVRGVTLLVKNDQFSFKAGQWVDVFIPGVDTIGGFSMYSAPEQLKQSNTLELGVKYSKWPPALWTHTQCKVGACVTVRAGGDFFYAPKVGDESYDVLLIGGGVGVNPLSSILLHTSYLHSVCGENANAYKPGKLTLLYSARNERELLYKKTFDDVADAIERVTVRYFSTREAPQLSGVDGGRINTQRLKESLQALDAKSLRVLICGPPPMIESMASQLADLGLDSKKQIFYEKWW